MENQQKKHVKKPLNHVSEAFYEVLRLGAKDKDTAVQSILELLQKAGLKNSRSGKEIDKKFIEDRYRAMTYAVKKQHGRWKGWRLENKKNLVQLVQIK